MSNVLITGANRGIGLKLVEHYCQQVTSDNQKWQVFATYRQEHDALLALTTQYGNLTLLSLDLADRESIAKLQHSMKGISLNLLINNAGVYGDKGHHFGNTDEQTLTKWHDVMHINAIAPMLVTEALFNNLQFGIPAKVAFITSKMGSMSDNGSGGAYIYRSSKAALNSIVKSLSIDLKPFHISVAAIHPGWVQTRMGGPNALIDTTTSVTGIAQVIAALDEQQSGGFFNYDGTTIDW